MSVEERLSEPAFAAFNALKDGYPNLRRKSWNVTCGKFKDLQQTPPLNFWGHDAQGDVMCEKPQLDEVSKGEIAHSDSFAAAMGETIAETETWCDVTSLSPPDGQFLEEFKIALKKLQEKSKPIVVRFLFGNILGMPTDCDSVVSQLTEDLEPTDPPTDGLQVWVGAWRSGVSWNHSKIIAVDGKSLFTGGHNLWTDHYLKSCPVHDLSTRLEGPIARDGHAFAEEMWQHVVKTDKGLFFNFLPDYLPYMAETRVTISQWPETANEYCEPWVAPDADEEEEGFPIIPMGRLGALHDGEAQASDDAFVALFGSAQNIVRISQQDLGPIAVPGPTGPQAIPGATWPIPYLKGLAKALDNGASIEIVVSNPHSVPGGLSPLVANYGNGWTCEDVTCELLKAIIETKGGEIDEAEQLDLLSGRIKVSFLRCIRGYDEWDDGSHMGNHAKFFIIDDKCCYIGSQNMYIANLAEWGVLIDDEETVGTVLNDYWIPMWRASHNPDAPDVNVDQVLENLGVDRSGENMSEEEKQEVLIKVLRQQMKTGGNGVTPDCGEIARRFGVGEDQVIALMEDEGFKPPKYAWKNYKKGDELPANALEAGETETDGKVYVARSLEGEPGKLNVDGDNCHNLWCHTAGCLEEGQVFVVLDDDAPLNWVQCEKGGAIPKGAVCAGRTETDGRCFVARFDGSCGKANTSAGRINNFWRHANTGWFSGDTDKSEAGEVLCIDPKETPTGGHWWNQLF